MFLACIRKRAIPGESICPCWLYLYVLFVILRLIVKLFHFFKRFFFWSDCLAFQPTLATIQLLMSPLLNVSAHNSTQCLCLGLQHTAA